MVLDPSKIPDSDLGTTSDEYRITQDLINNNANQLTSVDEADLLAQVTQALLDIRGGTTAGVSSDEAALITLIQGTPTYSTMGTPADPATHEGNYLGSGDY